MEPQRKQEYVDISPNYIAALFNKKPANDNEQGKLEELVEQGAKNPGNVNVVYLDDYRQRRLNHAYESTIGSYLNRRQQALHDFSDRVPGKHVSTFSRNEMPGVLGFTYHGQDRMALRDDLIGKTRKMVDIHESIHTPDEYETRRITDWIMSRPNLRYIK